jgi:hypothetical protein
MAETVRADRADIIQDGRLGKPAHAVSAQAVSRERTMHIAIGQTALATRGNALAMTIVVGLIATVAGGVLVTAWRDSVDVQPTASVSLPENTRPMILVPLPR